MPTVALDELQDHVGREVGVSDWVMLDQERIDRFADVTEDWQFIHVDPAAAAATPFGGTIAHGFLTLSMLSKLAYDAVLRVEGIVLGINYGFDRVRFLAPVGSGKRIRARFTLKSAEMKPPSRVLLAYEVTVEIEGEDKPALAAEWLTMQQLGPEAVKAAS